MNLAPHEIIVVIPTYNEAENIGSLIDDLVALHPDLAVIVVDDNSPDGTAQVVTEQADRHPNRVLLITRPAKNGIGPAYREGLMRALESNAPLIAQMDADHSHRPTDLLELIARTESADLVLGSRYVAGGNTIGWPRSRRLISALGGRYARSVLGVPVADLTGGFKVFQRDALAGIDISTVQSDGYVFQIETTYRAIKRGFRVVEHPITFTDRVAGKSKLSRTIVVEAMIVVWRLRFQRRAPASAA